MINPSALNGLTVYDAMPGVAVPPVPINFYSALSTPAYFRAVNFLADNLSSLGRSVTQNGVNPEKPHPLTSLLARRPNRYQNPTKLWRTLFFHVAHYANGYVRIERDPVTLQPIGLHNLLAENILPFRYDDGKGGGPVQYFAEFTTRKIWIGDDVIHLAGCSYDGMRGIDGIALHWGTLQGASTLDRFQLKYLQSGTNLRGSIEFQGELTPEKAVEVRQMLRDQFQGLEAADDILLLGNASLKNGTLSPQASQLVEQQSLTTKKISQITGVPPEFLFDKTESKYTGIEEAGENVVRYCLRPWIVQIEDECSLKLLSDAELDQGFRVSLDAGDLTRGDTESVTANEVAKKNAGITTANESRAALGEQKSDDPDADKLKSLGDTAPPKPIAPPAETK